MAMVCDVVIVRNDSTRILDKLDVMMQDCGYTLKAARQYDNESQEMRTYFGGEELNDMHERVSALSDKNATLEVRSYQIALR